MPVQSLMINMACCDTHIARMPAKRTYTLTMCAQQYACAQRKALSDSKSYK